MRPTLSFSVGVSFVWSSHHTSKFYASYDSLFFFQASYTNSSYLWVSINKFSCFANFPAWQYMALFKLLSAKDWQSETILICTVCQSIHQKARIKTLASGHLDWNSICNLRSRFHILFWRLDMFLLMGSDIKWAPKSEIEEWKQVREAAR